MPAAVLLHEYVSLAVHVAEGRGEENAEDAAAHLRVVALHRQVLRRAPLEHRHHRILLALDQRPERAQVLQVATLQPTRQLRSPRIALLDALAVRLDERADDSDGVRAAEGLPPRRTHLHLLRVVARLTQKSARRPISQSRATEVQSGRQTHRVLQRYHHEEALLARLQ